MNIDNSDKYDSKSGKGFKKIAKNFSFLAAGKIAGDFFSLVLFIVLSRKFGQEGLGQYSFAIGFAGFFAVCADFGLYNFTIREISRHKNSFESYFSRFFSLRLVQASAMLILLILVIPFVSFSFETKIIIGIIGFYLITNTIIEGLSAVFIAYEYMHISALIEFTLKIIASSITIVIAISGGSIIETLLVLPITALLFLFIVIRFLIKRIGKIKISFLFNSLKNTFKQAIPFGSFEFLYHLYARIDIVLIGFFLGEMSAGVYNAGYRIIFFLLFIPKFAAITILPIISRLFNDSPHEFRKMYNKSLSMIIIIGLPVCAGLFLIAPELVELIYGASFNESINVIKILSVLFLLTCISQIMETFLMASDNQSARAKSQWFAAWISVILNAILILLYGIDGAAIAVILSSVYLMVLFLIKLKPVVGLPDIKSKILISMLGAVIFFVLFTFIQLSIFIIIPVSALIYLGTIMLFEDVRKNELRMVFDLIRKR